MGDGGVSASIRHGSMTARTSRKTRSTTAAAARNTTTPTSRSVALPSCRFTRRRSSGEALVRRHSTANHLFGGLSSRQGVGAFQDFRAGTTEYTRNGANTWVRLRRPERELLQLRQFRRRRRHEPADVPSSERRRQLLGVGLQRQRPLLLEAERKPLWEMTTPSTAQTFGRGTPQPHYIVLADPVLKDPNNGNNCRMFGIRDNIPTTNVGEYARGERYYHVNPSPGGYRGLGLHDDRRDPHGACGRRASPSTATRCSKPHRTASTAMPQRRHWCQHRPSRFIRAAS
jgi:hypothetical protein